MMKTTRRIENMTTIIALIITAYLASVAALTTYHVVDTMHDCDPQAQCHCDVLEGVEDK